MRALWDMRGALTPDEEHAFHTAKNDADHRGSGYLSGRRLAGLLGPLAKAAGDLADATKSTGDKSAILIDYQTGFVDGWLDATFEDAERQECTP